MSYQIEAHGVFAAQLYEPSHCLSAVRRADSCNCWNAASVSERSDGESREIVLPQTRAAFILEYSQALELYERFEDKVRSMVCPLIKQLWGVDLPHCEGTQLVRYKAGGHYSCHQDSDDEEFASRYFTVLCYLNDAFHGGGTHFPSLSYTAAPATGKVLIFPSHYSHTALPITQGEKFIFLTWISGPIPIRWI